MITELKIANYYKVLNCNLDDSEREIYVKFKELVKKKHFEFADDFNQEQFGLFTEAYYLLSFSKWRKLYNIEYKRVVQYNPDSRLDQDEEFELSIAITKAQEFSAVNSKLPFKGYWKKIPKKMSMLQHTVEFIIDLFVT